MSTSPSAPPVFVLVTNDEYGSEWREQIEQQAHEIWPELIIEWIKTDELSTHLPNYSDRLVGIYMDAELEQQYFGIILARNIRNGGYPNIPRDLPIMLYSLSSFRVPECTPPVYSDINVMEPQVQGFILSCKNKTPLGQDRTPQQERDDAAEKLRQFFLLRTCNPDDPIAFPLRLQTAMEFGAPDRGPNNHGHAEIAAIRDLMQTAFHQGTPSFGMCNALIQALDKTNRFYLRNDSEHNQYSLVLGDLRSKLNNALLTTHIW